MDLHNPLSMISSVYRRGRDASGSGAEPDPDSPDTLSVFNAFTGAEVLASSYNFTTLDSLKTFIEQSFGISKENMFLLTPFGIKFKFSMLIHDEVKQLFVFDRKFFNPGLVDGEKSGELAKQLLKQLASEDLISLIKPRESPLVDQKLQKVVQEVKDALSANPNRLSSTQINLGNLRYIVGTLKRNSGWASALLADFRSTVFDAKLSDDNKEVKNILTSLNVLIQYIDLTFKDVEKRFNGLVDEFIALNSHSMHTTWEEQYDKLCKVQFLYHNNHRELETLALAPLADRKSLVKAATNASGLIEQINNALLKIRARIQSSIILPKQELVKQYDYYCLQYARETDKKVQEKRVDEYQTDFSQLERTITALTASSKSMPVFEDLITTTSGSSTTLSESAVSNIHRLVDLYDSCSQRAVPQISELAEHLYQSQQGRFELREQLQKKLVTSLLASLVDLQLKILETSKVLGGMMADKVADLKDAEVQLSVVSDLPLVFGIWVIANIGNAKHGKCLDKLAHKSGEVFEKMNFMERESRTKWLKEFSEGVGKDKLNLLKVDGDVKKLFVEKGLLNLRVVVEGKVIVNGRRGSSPNHDNNAVSGSEAGRRRSSSGGAYLYTLGKLLQHINGQPSRVVTAEAVSRAAAEESQARPVPNKLVVLLENVKVEDVIRYIESVKAADMDAEIPKQLSHYLNDLGINNDKPEHVHDDVVIKGGSTSEFGTFDSKDRSYTKFLKRYLKSFEIDGVSVEVTMNKKEKQGDSGMKSIMASKDLIAGYEARIKKLENLLHQQTFEQFNEQWSHKPVRMEFASDNSSSSKDQPPPALLTEPVELGEHKVVDLPPSHADERIERLQKENEQLKKELEALNSDAAEAELAELRKKNDNSSLEVEMLRKEGAEKDVQIRKLELQLQQAAEEKKTAADTQTKLDAEIASVKAKCVEIKSMNEDLVENLSQKENEFKQESHVNQEEINELRLKLDEAQEDQRLAAESTKDMNEKLDSGEALQKALFALVKNLVQKLNSMTGKVHEDLTAFCLILESIGLLLVREPDNDQLTIKRVKGLRGRKRQQLLQRADVSLDMTASKEELAESTVLEVLASDVIEESRKRIEWVPKFVEPAEEDKQENASAEEEEEGMEEIKPDTTVDYLTQCKDMDSKYTDFASYTYLDTRGLIGKISRRFNDVETLARRLQKEKAQQKVELKALTSEVSHQLTIRNFKVGDLVLFLKTLNTAVDPATNDGDMSVVQPWAVFNIGSPNHYFKNAQGDGYIDLSSRDWFVGRIQKIETKTVTQGNFNNAHENPFKLAVGFTWHYVEAKEEVN